MMTDWIGLLALAGCLESGGGERVFRVEIGPDGGELAGAGLTLTVPPGALSETEELVMRVRDDAPGGFDPISSRYRFEPEGITFAELATVAVEVEVGPVGTLYWSTPDGGYEQIGLAAAGLAEGTTWHFSDSFTGEGVCSVPESTTKCACRAGDEQGDLLCPEDPSGGASCDVNGFGGSNGGSCSGYGQRTETVPWCSCLTSEGDYLCPDPYQFDPSQNCPTDGGLNGFHAEEGTSCSGYDLDWDPQSGEAFNVSASGTVVDCQEVPTDTTWQSVSGTLEDCYETVAAPVAPDCRDEQHPIEKFCTDLVSDTSQRRQDEAKAANRPPVLSACPAEDAVQSAAQGSRAGSIIEQAFLDADPDPANPSHFTQFEIPNARKTPDCYSGKDNVGPSGKVDLLRIVSKDASQLVVEIGEVKPMTNSGLDDGWRDIFQCYARKLAEAGARCKTGSGPVTDEIQGMCDALGADGREVVLSPERGLSWTPSELLPVEFTEGGGGGTNELYVQTCAPGIVAYQCAQ